MTKQSYAAECTTLQVCKPQCIGLGYLLVFLAEHHLLGIDAVVSPVTISQLTNIHDASQSENITLSTKPEVDNIWQCRQRRIQAIRQQV